MSLRLRVFNYAEAFSNGRPIILLLYKLFTKWRITPLQNDIQNISSEFNSFVHKTSHVQKIRYANDGVYTYASQLSL